MIAHLNVQKKLWKGHYHVNKQIYKLPMVTDFRHLQNLGRTNGRADGRTNERTDRQHSIVPFFPSERVGDDKQIELNINDEHFQGAIFEEIKL